MTTADELRGLLERVEGGDDTGALQSDIVEALAPDIIRETKDAIIGNERYVVLAGTSWLMPPPILQSLDAAIALVERVLPGWKWSVGSHGGRFRAGVVKTSPLRPMPTISNADTPALALIAALLRAKIAEMETT